MPKTKSIRIDKVLVFIKTFFKASTYGCRVHINPQEFVQPYNNGIVINTILHKEKAL